MTETVNHERVFYIFFVYVRTANGTTSDYLVYLFGFYDIFYWGEGKGG